MKRSRQPAVIALMVVAAGATQQHRRIAASVAQQDHLLVAAQCLFDLFTEHIAENDLAGSPWSRGLFEIDEDACRELPLTDPFGEDTLSEESLSEEDLAPAGDPAWVDSQLETPYFDFDRSSLSDSARLALDNNADFLLAHQEVNVRIEGHCDERGTTEYNLSLGDRRASSAKEYLILRGVAEDRLLVVSFGEERPADPGQNDAAWARNRRVEFHAR